MGQVFRLQPMNKEVGFSTNNYTRTLMMVKAMFRLMEKTTRLNLLKILNLLILEIRSISSRVEIYIQLSKNKEANQLLSMIKSNLSPMQVSKCKMALSLHLELVMPSLMVKTTLLGITETTIQFTKTGKIIFY